MRTQPQTQSERLDDSFHYDHKTSGISVDSLLLDDDRTLLLTIALGGRRAGTLGLVRGDSGASDGLLAFDLDPRKVPRNSGSFVGLPISRGAQRMLTRRERMRSLKGDQVPEGLQLPVGSPGAGLRRLVATVVLFYEWQKVVTAVNKVVETELSQFKNRQPKTVIVRLVSSLGGGTGSALIIPLAMLMRERVSMIAPNAQVTIQLHAVSGMVFHTKLRTGLERRRCLANTVTTIREILHVQTPENRLPLAETLGINRRSVEGQKLVDQIVFYGHGSSGSASQDEELLHAVLATNLLADSNKALEVVASNEANTESCQEFRNTDVFAVRVSFVARVPVDKIATAQAWHSHEEGLRNLLESGDDAGELSRGNRNRVMNELEFAKVTQQLTQSLRQRFNEGSDREDFRNVADRDASLLQRDVERRLRYFGNEGQIAFEQESERLKSTFVEATEQHAARLIDLCRELAGGLPSCRRLLAVLLAAIEEEYARVSERLTELRKEDAEKVLRHRLDQWRRESGSWGRRGNHRDICLQSWKHLVDVTYERLTLELFRDYWLKPVHKMLQQQQERISELEVELELRRQAVHREAMESQLEVPFENGFFTTIVRDRDVEPILKRLSSAIAKKHAGQPPLLSLNDVLDAPRDELKTVLQRVWSEGQDRVRKFFAEDIRDLKGFLEFYDGTGFNAAKWMAISAQQPLPACVNVYDREPGNSPVDGFVVGPESLRDTWRHVDHAIQSEIPMAWQESTESFELVVQMAQTAIPVSALPGLDEMIQAESDIETMSPPANDPTFPILWSHGYLKDARHHPLTPDEEELELNQREDRESVQVIGDSQSIDEADEVERSMPPQA